VTVPWVIGPVLQPLNSSTLPSPKPSEYSTQPSPKPYELISTPPSSPSTIDQLLLLTPNPTQIATSPSTQMTSEAIQPPSRQPEVVSFVLSSVPQASPSEKPSPFELDTDQPLPQQSSTPTNQATQEESGPKPTLQPISLQSSTQPSSTQPTTFLPSVNPTNQPTSVSLCNANMSFIFIRTFNLILSTIDLYIATQSPATNPTVSPTSNPTAKVSSFYCRFVCVYKMCAALLCRVESIS